MSGVSCCWFMRILKFMTSSDEGFDLIKLIISYCKKSKEQYCLKLNIAL